MNLERGDLVCDWDPSLEEPEGRGSLICDQLELRVCTCLKEEETVGLRFPIS